MGARETSAGLAKGVALLGGLVLAGMIFGCSSAPPKDPVKRAARAKDHYKEAVNLTKAGELDAAIDRYNAAFQLEPSWSILRYDLGRVLDTQSMIAADKARNARQREDREEAQRFDDEARALHARALADLNAAREHLLFAAERMPWESNVYFYLSQVYTGLSDFGKAKDYLQKAIDKGPPPGYTRANLEVALKRLEQFEQAQSAGVEP